jgi:riboflavin kinase / FMN adenylyltransferase
MELIRGLVNLSAQHRGCVVTIGTFDGIHLGHQALIERTLAHGAKLGLRTMMVTFEPMPREVLRPSEPPARLTSLRERWRILERTGLDLLCVLPFSPRLQNLSGDEFAQLLCEELASHTVVVGHDFRFGRRGEAGAAILDAAGARLGFAVDVVEPVLAQGARVSSSAVREALARGDFAVAACWLGRPYAMRGRVGAGTRLGRTLGFPTANVRLNRRRSPLGGVFAVRVRGVAQHPWPAVASLGTRPTVGGIEPLLEVFLFDYSGDLYGREIEVEFVAKLRAEARFDGLEALVAQMQRDAAQAREILARPDVN